MAADAGVVLVLVDHHRHRVPADDALDTPFHGAVARIRHLDLRGYAIDVRRVEVDGQLGACRGGALIELFQQIGGTIRAGFVQDLVQGVQPFPGFLGIQVYYPFCYVLVHLCLL